MGTDTCHSGGWNSNKASEMHMVGGAQHHTFSELIHEAFIAVLLNTYVTVQVILRWRLQLVAM